MNYPKVLVVANNCFSLTNSNGRTLGNFFEGWPVRNLAQFCLGLENPNEAVCQNYFCVTDSDAVRSFVFRSRAARAGDGQTQTQARSNRSNRKKTALLALIRHLVWSSKRWMTPEFWQWVDHFDPDLVLLQNGDSAFMLQLALNISRKRNIPLVVFNTEGYYFFRKNYMHEHWTDFICYPLYRGIYRRRFRRMIACAACSIYGNSLLKEDYDCEFDRPGAVLYTSSSLSFEPREFDAAHPRFSYLGNLGLDRTYALIEIANALHYIDGNYYLDVYGKLPLSMEGIFDNCRSIRYHGMIDYDRVTEVMRSSDLLFHAEAFCGKWTSSLKYGFSTKIADSLASGCNFMLYAPSYIAGSKYIIENGAGWYVGNPRELIDVLRRFLSDGRERAAVLRRAEAVAAANHNPGRNSAKFLELLNSVLGN